MPPLLDGRTFEVARLRDGGERFLSTFASREATENFNAKRLEPHLPVGLNLALLSLCREFGRPAPPELDPPHAVTERAGDIDQSSRGGCGAKQPDQNRCERVPLSTIESSSLCQPAEAIEKVTRAACGGVRKPRDQ